jgi:hypothetical protein
MRYERCLDGKSALRGVGGGVSKAMSVHQPSGMTLEVN